MPESRQLIIDEQAASVRIDDAVLRDWGADNRVFVSSLIADMPLERAQVRAAIERVGARPVMFERELGAQDVGAEQAYLSGVSTADIYVGVLGPRYGIQMSNGYSATHAEYLEAVRTGRRLAIFVDSDRSRPVDGHQQDLIGSIRNFIVTAPYDSPETLGQGVEERLREIASQTVAPWVRIDDVVFRATSVSVDSRQIVIEADIRNQEILNRLEFHRERKSGDLEVAIPRRALVGQMSDIASKMTAVNRTHLTITLSIREGRNQGGISFGTMTYGGGETISQAEYARRALQDGVFGTATLPHQGWGTPEKNDPFGPLRGRHLNDAVLRPVAELLLSDALLRGNVAAQVDQFRLGPSPHDQRQMSVTWTPPRQHQGVPAVEPLSIEGSVTGL